MMKMSDKNIFTILRLGWNRPIDAIYTVVKILKLKKFMRLWKGVLLYYMKVLRGRQDSATIGLRG